MTDQLAEDDLIDLEQVADNSFMVSLNRMEVIKALNALYPVVENRNILPILSNVKLEAKENLLILTATDMDLTVSATIPATVTNSGDLTVSAALLYDIFKKINNDTVTLQFANNASQIHISAGSCEFKLAILPASDFPIMEIKDTTHAVDLPFSQLKKIITQTSFAVSKEETRYNLTGVYLHVTSIEGAEHLTAAATDGHRLAISATEMYKSSTQFLPGVILPKKAVGELKKFAPIDSDNADNENIHIEFSETKIMFSYGNLTMISKIIDGNFPEYKGFLPSNNNNIVEIDKDLFEKAIERASIVTVEKFRAVKLALTNNKINISAYGDSAGSAREEIPANYEGEELEIGFNPKYLLDVLSVIDSATVQISLNDSFSPALIKDTNNQLSSFVVMPIKV